ncbi:unnamed protein product [Ceutorhynchus assimilis]|uniref:YqaJ viral recombinase domain-containing protein n=1 Tax=Ceutorhynchus assimilis TaxID=467358 RepID=A0A9N9MHY7_9CUCU|nr:unnamed protein product [Ceutorhynchus assimilis]
MFSCTLENLVFANEVQEGLLSKFLVKCNMCNYSAEISSADPKDHKMNLNKCLVNVVTSIGCGFAHLQDILNNLQLPVLSQRKYADIQSKLFDEIEESAIQEMRKAADEEKAIALSEKNVGVDGVLEILVVPSLILNKKYEKRRQLLHYRQKPRKKLFKEKDHKEATNTNKNYGPNCEKPDMTLEEYQERKEEFLKNIKKTKTEIENIEERTREQANSTEWLEARRIILTASNFATICKRRPTTYCGPLVKTLLTNSFIQSSALSWGRDNEGKAFEELMNKQKLIIKKCGLFISEKHSFLGASPDGLIGNNGLVEIKCPWSARHLTPEEGISQKKITIWKYTKDECILNTNHKWYFQVQGQLAVTDRAYCVLCVWTPLDPVDDLINAISLIDINPSLLILLNDSGNRIRPSIPTSERIESTPVISQLPASSSNANLVQPIDSSHSIDMSPPTTPTITNKELDSFVQTIPSFDPQQPDTLSTFILGVDEVIQLFLNQTFAMCSNTQLYLLNLHILKRITGSAHTYIRNNKLHTFIPNGFGTWYAIRAALLDQFGQLKTRNCLLREMTEDKQKPTETYRDFYLRVNTKLNELMQQTHLHIQDPAKAEAYNDMYREEALQTFVAGLNSPFREALSNIEVSTLRACIDHCEKYNNILMRHRALQSRSNTVVRPSANNNNIKSFQRQNLTQAGPSNFRNQMNPQPRFFNPNYRNFPNQSNQNISPKYNPPINQQIKNNQIWEPMSARTSSNRQNLYNVELDPHNYSSYYSTDPDFKDANSSNEVDNNFVSAIGYQQHEFVDEKVTHVLDNNVYNHDSENVMNNTDETETENFQILASNNSAP